MWEIHLELNITPWIKQNFICMTKISFCYQQDILSTFGDEETVFVGLYGVSGMVTLFTTAKSIRCSRGTTLEKILDELSVSFLWSKKKKTLQPSSKMLRSRPLKLCKRDVPYVRYHGTGLFKNLFPSPTPFPSILLPSYLLYSKTFTTLLG